MNIIKLENNPHETIAEQNKRKAEVLDKMYEYLQRKMKHNPPPYWFIPDTLNKLVAFNKESMED